MGLEPTTFGSEVRRAIHYATRPIITNSANYATYNGGRAPEVSEAPGGKYWEDSRGARERNRVAGVLFLIL